MTTRRGVLLWACALSGTGCGYGLNQTAKTQLPGTVSLATGVSYVSNDVLSAQGLPTYKLAAEVGPLRVGLSDHVDIGVGLFYVQGVRVDSKFNVMPRASPLAIAPRIGAGYATSSDRSTAMWMAGVIGSYDLTSTFTPYLSATFANHWFASPTPVVDLGQGERLAPPTGAGDGLLQLVAGFEWRVGSVALSAEYGRWLPMQNDPGTFYAFVETEVVSLGVRVCFERRCE